MHHNILLLSCATTSASWRTFSKRGTNKGTSELQTFYFWIPPSCMQWIYCMVHLFCAVNKFIIIIILHLFTYIYYCIYLFFAYLFIFRKVFQSKKIKLWIRNVLPLSIHGLFYFDDGFKLVTKILRFANYSASLVDMVLVPYIYKLQNH